MILPRLFIDDNGNSCRMEIYDPEAPEYPLFVMSGIGMGTTTVADVFINFLASATENYGDGYDIGYIDCADDMEGGEFEDSVVY